MPYKCHRLIHPAAVLAAVLFSAALNAATPSELEFTEQQRQTTREIVQKLHKNHYRDQPIDDELSEKFLDNYLSSLDPGRAYFLQTDIAAFHERRHRFDEYFREGRLGAAYEIFRVYRERMSARLKSVLKQLKNDERTYNFDEEESLTTDRDEAPWLASEDAADEFWRKRIKADLLSLKLAGKTIEDSRETLIERYSAQLRRLNQQTGRDVFNTVINAFTTLYDPHTNYLSPRMLENFNINMSLSLEGIGAMLQSEDEYTKVVRIIPAGPADKQGQLQPADRIIAVGQGAEGEMVDVVGWRLDEVVDLIRGEKGSIVRLEVLSGQVAAGSHTIAIKRDKVKLEEQDAKKATFEVTDGSGETYKLGVIDIPTFYMDFEAYRQRDPNYKSTTRDVFNLLGELAEENVDGIIIDLRNNGGGSLHEATSLTDLFIDRGPVVQIRQTNQLISRNYRSKSKAVYRGPIVVLINRLSASASEIFAGAIQDYGRGIIIGTQSFGKGSVQSLQPLEHGQLKITESKFYRVSGKSTQHRGVVPDIDLPELVDPTEVGESSYDYALPWDKIHPVQHARYFDIDKLLPALEKAHAKRVSQDPDFEFLSAQQALIEQYADRETVSLRQKTRMERKQDYEHRLLALENQRRKAKGLIPYATYSDISGRVDGETSPPETAGTGATKIKPHDDPFLNEAGHVLVDFIRELEQASPKVANF